MPYYNNDNINLLFIHIPKTGGTSVEKYLSSKYNIELNNYSLYNDNTTFNNVKIFAPLTHILYKTIIKYKDEFHINIDNLEIITIVRNPYNRIISGLFYWGIINDKSSKNFVYENIKKYINSPNIKFDNHNLPQYLFLENEDGIIPDNIKILRTETLNADMKKNGYTDFTIKDNVNKYNMSFADYYKYLNEKSIKLINHYYRKDFEYFNYDKINI